MEREKARETYVAYDLYRGRLRVQVCTGVGGARCGRV